MDDGDVVRHEQKGDTHMSIRVDVMNARDVYKGEMCHEPSFLLWCYNTGLLLRGWVLLHVVADYTQEDPNNATAVQLETGSIDTYLCCVVLIKILTDTQLCRHN